MKVFHAVARANNYDSAWSVQEYRQRLWCAAFQVDSLDGIFDMVPAESAIEILTGAINRFDANTEELRQYLDPQDFAGMRGNKRIFQGMRKFLIANGGHFSGAVEKSELDAPAEGDASL